MTSELALDTQEQKNQEVASGEPSNSIPTWEQVADFNKIASEMGLAGMIRDSIFKGREENKNWKDPNDQYDDQADTDPGEAKDQEHRDCHGN